MLCCADMGSYPGCNHYDLVCDEEDLMNVAFQEVDGTGSIVENDKNILWYGSKISYTLNL